MRTLLCSLIIGLAASSAGLAQSISVVLGGTTPCTFTASGFSDGFTNRLVFTTTGITPGKGAASPATLVKTVDKCSSGMVKTAFTNGFYGSVTISVTALVAGVNTPVRTITLTNAAVSSIAVDESAVSAVTGLPFETVTLVYQKIQIQDLINKTTTTCDFVKFTCS